MGTIRLFQIPRRGIKLVTRLLDEQASIPLARRFGCQRQADIGAVPKGRWHRRFVTLKSAGPGHVISVAFGNQPPRTFAGTKINHRLYRPDPKASLHVTLKTNVETHILEFPPPSWLQNVSARLIALPKVLWLIAKTSPTLVRFIATGDAGIAKRLRDRFGLDHIQRGTPIPRNLFGPCPVAPTPETPTIVVPVFNALDDVTRLLGRLNISIGADHHLVLIDDGSTDQRVQNLLAEFEQTHPSFCTLIRHPSNLGFVAAANSGIKAAKTMTRGHVILLNSDTLPPDDWVNRLLAPIMADASIASATPLSNAAEILSVPGHDSFDQPSDDLVTAMDSIAQTLTQTTVSTPTGVGFCMALNRAFLDRIGGFDPAFGRGYGEEVDWCQKALALGGRHVAVLNLFVGHRGAASFGNTEKTHRRRQANALIARRYPRFSTDVQAWCRDDPMAPARLALSLTWLGAMSKMPVPVFLGHSMGGGAETVLRSEIEDCLLTGHLGVVVVRVGGSAPWQIELIRKGSVQIGEVSDTDLLHKLLAPLTTRQVIYSCGVGALDPVAIPDLLTKLVRVCDRLDLRLHDFFPISPSWNLLGQDGCYVGPPHVDTSDPAHGINDAKTPAVSHRDWRKMWEPVIARADDIRAFAQSGADILNAAYPNANATVTVQPHQLAELPPILKAGGQTIGVLGGINLAKGAKVLQRLTQVHDRRVVVIGPMDGAFRLSPPHHVHGIYAKSDIAGLARQYDIGLWIIPSICPETFSFATHEALATGLPVIGFDLGAQGEALNAAENGYLSPGGPDHTAGLIDMIEGIVATQSDPGLKIAS